MYGRYQVIIFTFAGLALVYAAIGAVSVTHIIKQKEIFPFFSWSLFTSPSRTYVSYHIVASLEGAGSDAGPWPNEWLPEGNEFLWLPADAETKLTPLSETLREMGKDLSRKMGRNLSGGGSPSEVLAKWRPHLDRFVPEGYSGYYIVALRVDVIDFYQGRDRNKTGQTLEYFRVER